MNRTPGERRAAYMRQVRRADYHDAQNNITAGDNVVNNYEDQCNERRAKVTILSIDTGAYNFVELPVII